MSTAFRLLAAAVALTILVGCVTAETRIKRNPTLYAQLTPEQESLVREGQIRLGFTREMVKIALGEPVVTRKTYQPPSQGAEPVLVWEMWLYQAGARTDWGHSEGYSAEWGHNNYFGDAANGPASPAKTISDRSWSEMVVSFNEKDVVGFSQIK